MRHRQRVFRGDGPRKVRIGFCRDGIVMAAFQVSAPSAWPSTSSSSARRRGPHCEPSAGKTSSPCFSNGAFNPLRSLTSRQHIAGFESTANTQGTERRRLSRPRRLPVVAGRDAMCMRLDDVQRRRRTEVFEKLLAAENQIAIRLELVPRCCACPRPDPATVICGPPAPCPAPRMANVPRGWPASRWDAGL